MSPLPVGARAPRFSIGDGGRLDRADTSPCVVVFAASSATGRSDGQPLVQHLTIDGERLPVFTPASSELAEQFGVSDQLAVFVVDAHGRIAWRHARSDGAAISVPDAATSTLSRREFLAATLAASIAATFATTFASSAAAAPLLQVPAEPAVREGRVSVQLVVNGRHVDLSIDPRMTLLDALRERLALTGTKKGCDHGQCGACTVHVGGRRVLSCLTLAAAADGKAVTTIEGLAGADGLHPMQQAFIEHDGFQCGYCTAGQIMSAVALLREPCGPTDDEVRECMSGNICRCGAYPGIVAAVQAVRGSAS